ncbi:MAG TPA: 50S ribosomal protein L11 methyltransferase [Allosphingosinicella sp.]|nr:50S ribosomal protein L11 methyltransferase [Allosphingosinicella sp.]
MDSWKVTLPCTRAEADLLKEDIAEFARFDVPPVLMTSEVDPSRPDHWRLDAYFDREPEAPDLALLQSLVPSAKSTRPEIEAITDQDWVTLSQQGLEPIQAGRFFVHTPAHRNAVPAGAIAFEVDAGRAFGTGQHETTTGCLLALDRLKKKGAAFSDIADLGTGTGLLAFAATRTWPAARVIASDIDPVAIEVAAENAAINRIDLGRARGQLELVVAAGLDHRRLKGRAPYDLIIANILAGPLIEMAPGIAGALAPGGQLILAGLLDHQKERVAGAYRRHGLMLCFAVSRGDWPTLVMRKRRRPALPRRAAGR